MAVRRKIVAADLEKVDLEALFIQFQRGNEARGLSHPTRMNYHNSFLKFFEFLGSPKVSDPPTEENVQDYIRALLASGMKPVSVNHYLRDLRAFLYFAMEKEEIPPFKVRLMKVQEEVPDPYTIDQLRVLVKEPLKDDSFVVWRTWAIIYWILDTGNRAETVCNIKMGDISEGRVRLAHTKNKRAQIIELGVALMPILTKYIRKFRSDASANDYLFPSVYGDKLTVNALKKSLTDYNRKRGVEKTSIHDLRRTYTTMALASGNTTEQEVADRLGHGNTALLKRYACFTSAQKRAFHNASSPLNELTSGGIRKHVVKKT